MNTLLLGSSARLQPARIESMPVDNRNSVVRNNTQMALDFSSMSKGERRRRRLAAQTQLHRFLNPRFWNEFTPEEWEALRRMEQLSGLIHQPGYAAGEVNWDMARPPIARISPSRTRLAGTGRARPLPFHVLARQVMRS